MFSETRGSGLQGGMLRGGVLYETLPPQEHGKPSRKPKIPNNSKKHRGWTSKNHRKNQIFQIFRMFSETLGSGLQDSPRSMTPRVSENIRNIWNIWFSLWFLLLQPPCVLELFGNFGFLEAFC